MKYLLDNQYAPLTFEWGFVQAPLEDVTTAFTDWMATHHPVTANPYQGALETLLTHLAPLTIESSKHLFVETHSDWVAYFNNNLYGSSEAYAPVSILCEIIHCQGVAVTTRPRGFKRIQGGGVTFVLFAPEAREHRNVERLIELARDGGRWSFRTLGKPQPYEDLAQYHNWRTTQRFTVEMLIQYCGALGIELINPDFYGPNGVLMEQIDSQYLIQSMPLREAQVDLGIVAGNRME